MGNRARHKAISVGEEFDPGEMKAFLDQVSPDRLRRPAADIKDGRAGRQERGKAIEPRFFEQAAPAIGIPVVGLSLVKIDDPLGRRIPDFAVIRHRAAIPQLRHIGCAKLFEGDNESA